jgi:hypothetical protein
MDCYERGVYEERAPFDQNRYSYFTDTVDLRVKDEEHMPALYGGAPPMFCYGWARPD